MNSVKEFGYSIMALFDNGMEQQHDFSLFNSIQLCRRLTALAHSNFAPAFALLPPAKRQAMEILYAYTRFTDDLADLPDYDPESGDSVHISLRRKKQKFNQWVSVVESVLGKIGDENPPSIDPNDESIFQEINQQYPGCGGLVFLPALKMIVDKYNIPRQSLFHLIDGVETDMDWKPFQTFDDSAEYCHQVATSVGFASLAIWGTNEPLFSGDVVKAAKACGVAFQWTNIIRDMLEDYRNGRVYLPQSELQRFGLTEKQLGTILDGANWVNQKPIIRKCENFSDYNAAMRERGKWEEKFNKLMTHQIRRCEVYYENSIPLYHLLHRDSQRMFGLMWNSYYTLFQQIRRNPWLVTKENRIRLSSQRLFRLWLRWRFMPCWQLR